MEERQAPAVLPAHFMFASGNPSSSRPTQIDAQSEVDSDVSSLDEEMTRDLKHMERKVKVAVNQRLERERALAQSVRDHRSGSTVKDMRRYMKSVNEARRASENDAANAAGTGDNDSDQDAQEPMRSRTTASHEATNFERLAPNQNTMTSGSAVSADDTMEAMDLAISLTDVDQKWEKVLAANNHRLQNIIRTAREDPEWENLQKLREEVTVGERKHRKSRYEKEMGTVLREYKANMRERLKKLNVPDDQLEEDGPINVQNPAEVVIGCITRYRWHDQLRG